MTQTNLNAKIFTATKWSALTEILSKLVTPITTMVLARILTPEAYGVVATFSIIIALSEVFSDAGFQKYLIQKKFNDDLERDRHTNVAFWSNLVMSISLWVIIVIFCHPLALLVGSPGLGFALVVSCVGIPLTGFSSIQMSLMKRDFDFKTLFGIRLFSILIPIFITIPLALVLRNYWALVLGNLVVNFATALFVSIKSTWRPQKFYSFRILKEMFSFCSWSLIDSILVWATAYADIFFISRYLDSYYLGLYRTSISMVGHIVTLITATVLPVLMPSLSRLQDNLPEMRHLLLKFQKTTGIILIPLGFGIFVFQDFITEVILGSQWLEAAGVFGLWGLMEAITVIFARFCSPVYPAIGKPRVSVIVQFFHVIVLIPAIIVSGKYGFEALYITRSLIRLELVLVNVIAIYIMINQSFWKMLLNVMPQFICSAIMALIGCFLLRINKGLLISVLWVFICMGAYFLSMYILFPKDWAQINSLRLTVLNSMKRN